ncbi:MAG: crossover junction endodeoxyribonuclease RuvC [Ferrimicrobium sp.]
MGGELRRVLGVDPGLRRVGYSVLEQRSGSIALVSAGLIVTKSGVPRGERLLDIHRCIIEVIDQYEPGNMVIERVLFARNVSSALMVAEAIGSIRLAGALRGLEAVEVGANQVKLGLSGDGNASKQQMQQMVRLLLDLAEPPRPPDVADAIAVAYAYLSGVVRGLDDR